MLLGKDNQKNHNDQQESAKNVDINHHIKNIIHNYSINNKLQIQKENDKANPSPDVTQSVEPLINGPINCEAKNIRPTSLLISDNFSNLDEDNCIYDNYNS